jgi:hypothetical protein
MGYVNLIHVPDKATFMGSKSCSGQFHVRGYHNPPGKLRPFYMPHNCTKDYPGYILKDQFSCLMGAQLGMKVSCETT